jgi:outer membrane protein TolC
MPRGLAVTSARPASGHPPRDAEFDTLEIAGMRIRALRGLLVAASAASFVAGCAVATGPSSVAPSMPDPGQVAAESRAGYPDVPAIRSRLSSLISGTVDADAAVRVALLASPDLHRIYFDLRIPPETILAAIDATGPEDAVELRFVERALGELRRSSSEVEALNFETAKLAAAGEIARLALDVRKAHAAAVGATHVARLVEESRVASEAAAELGRRMARVGNWPRLNEFRESAALGEASVQAARARQASLVARNRLTRLLGVWGEDTRYRLPETLPGLPDALPTIADPEALAVAQRYDLRALTIEIAAEVREFELDGYDKASVTVSEFREMPVGRALGAGAPERRVRVPIFDLSAQAGAAKQARFMALVNQASRLSINVRADAREAYVAYRTAFDIARHYSTHMLPLQTRIMDENVLRYNGMLQSVFELLADARQRTAVEVAATEALRDLWIADADRRGALIGGGYAGAMPAASVPGGGAAAPGH